MHRSLVGGGALVRARNVLKRHERLAQLQVEGRWAEEKDSPYGLPKVRVLKVKKRGKEKKKKEDEE
jgi:small basic protein (TIGR04137 family)